MQGTVTQALGQEGPLDKEASKPGLQWEWKLTSSLVSCQIGEDPAFSPDAHIEVSPPCSECGYSGGLLCSPGPQLTEGSSCLYALPGPVRLHAHLVLSCLCDLWGFLSCLCLLPLQDLFTRLRTVSPQFPLSQDLHLFWNL